MCAYRMPTSVRPLARSCPAALAGEAIRVMNCLITRQYRILEPCCGLTAGDAAPAQRRRRSMQWSWPVPCISFCIGSAASQAGPTANSDADQKPGERRAGRSIWGSTFPQPLARCLPLRLRSRYPCHIPFRSLSRECAGRRRPAEIACARLMPRVTGQFPSRWERSAVGQPPSVRDSAGTCLSLRGHRMA